MPLALVKSEGELSHVSELDEALKDYPLEWQQLQHEHPEQWAEVLAKQNKYRRQAGAAELTVKPKAPSNQRIYYYHVDHLGTPQELTDQTGNIVWSAQYKAWGKVQTIEQPQICIQEQHGSALTERWIEPESIEQPLRFQSQYYDQETELHYNRFRYYDPDIGRFISQDPIGLMGGFNLYQYAPNPVVWVDPFGLNARPETAAQFEKRISNKMSPAERVIAVKGKIAKVARKNGWEYDSKLSRINDRDVYRTKDGELRAADTQHGRIEYTDKKGRHIDEVNIDGEFKDKTDKKGGHNLKC